MDLVLGLSLTSSAVRWVLVEGCAGEGHPVDRGELDIPTIDRLDAELLGHAVLNPDVVAEKRIRVVGLTATCGAGEAAATVAGALVARGHHAVVQVPDRTAVAALALARGAALAAARTYSLSPPVESAAPAPENVAP